MIHDVKVLFGIYFDKNPEIMIVGHSLGGVLSNFMAIDIKKVIGKVDHLITFEQPRVGNTYFARFLTE